MPVAILTTEAATAVHERVYGQNQTLAHDLTISNDPATLVHDIAMRLRRRSFQ